MTIDGLSQDYPWAATRYPEVDSVESALKALRFGRTI